MKKVILILLVILSVNSNAIGKNLPLMTSEQIIAKCQPENFNNYTSDKDLSAKVDKENKCLKEQVFLYIRNTIKKDKQEQAIKSFTIAERELNSFYSLLFLENKDSVNIGSLDILLSKKAYQQTLKEILQTIVAQKNQGG